MRENPQAQAPTYWSCSPTRLDRFLRHGSSRREKNRSGVAVAVSVPVYLKISGCKVSVTCMDDRSRVVYYGSDEIDDAGDFEMIVNGKKLNTNSCFFRLVSSPDPVCNIATDFAGGLKGEKLNRPAVVYRDMVKHVLGPFYYTTPMCDEPDTTDSTHDGKQSNY